MCICAGYYAQESKERAKREDMKNYRSSPERSEDAGEKLSDSNKQLFELTCFTQSINEVGTIGADEMTIEVQCSEVKAKRAW